MAEGQQQQGGQQGTGGAQGGGQAPPWHAGVEPEILGHWQNRNVDLSDPAKVAIEMTKAHRNAESKMGIPAEQLIRLPATAQDEAGWKSVWTRLGVPAEAKDYDLAGVKFGDGTELEPSFAESMRAALASARVTKENAPTVVKAVVKYLDDAEQAETATRAAQVAEQKAALRTNWGNNFDFNHLKAMEGARRLGITPEAVQALENQIGYAGVMEAMRKIGSISAEHEFVDGGQRTGVMTQEGAAARKAELMMDAEWSRKLLAGDPAARREWDALERLITGVMEAA